MIYSDPKNFLNNNTNSENRNILFILANDFHKLIINFFTD